MHKIIVVKIELGQPGTRNRTCTQSDLVNYSICNFVSVKPMWTGQFLYKKKWEPIWMGSQINFKNKRNITKITILSSPCGCGDHAALHLLELGSGDSWFFFLFLWKPPSSSVSLFFHFFSWGFDFRTKLMMFCSCPLFHLLFLGFGLEMGNRHDWM